MSNSLPEVPNSPAELVALQAKESFDSTNPDAFADLVSDLVVDTEPSPEQALRTALRLVDELYCYHFSQVENANELELSAFQRQLWKDDTKLLKKALLALRQVST